MRTHVFFRWVSLCAFLLFMAGTGLQGATAAPPAPLPISPAAGGIVVLPTFSWAAATGAVKYELEVGPQSNPTAVYWTMQTASLAITPVDGAPLVDDLLYWRVRAYDSANTPGTWSARVNFTRSLGTPQLVSPTDGQTLAVPGFIWNPAEGAVTYRVDLSDTPTFASIIASYTTYNTTLSPVNTIAEGTYYWRVTALDAAGHPGTSSAGWSFIKNMPAPTSIYPVNGMSLVIPAFAWQASAGAVTYKVELSSSPTFVPIDETYTTYNYLLIPQTSLPNGTFYWRVSGVDTDGHVGTPGGGLTFTKYTSAPTLVSPAADAAISTPTLEWQAVEGAVYYKVELSPSPTFIPIEATYTTYNLRLTPRDTLPLGDHYWRVSGLDRDDHAGYSASRKFTLLPLAVPTDTTPQLLTPADGEALAADPNFSWTRVVGAADYHLLVSKYADFHTSFDSVFLDYASYTTYSISSHDAYPNGTYYWKVQARNGSGTVIATSAARSFSKNQPLNLVQPEDASSVQVGPNFEWEHFVGADRYHLLVSKYADFQTSYDSVYVDYRGYTPYTPGNYDVYANDTYYWKVQARDASGAVLAESLARSFIKETPVQLYTPADGDTSLTLDPAFWWRYVPGASTYHLLVSKVANFSPLYDSVYTDYPFYTPFEAGDHNAYPNGTYYWKVEARGPSSAVIAASDVRSFGKNEPLDLATPADGSHGNPPGPAFSWQPASGALSYRLIVSQFADFHLAYDSVITAYPAYAPYSAGTRTAYADGSYYWKVEARNSEGALITTSNVWSFSTGVSFATYLPVIRR